MIGDTREVGRTTIFFDAVIVMLALEMTAALMADVLVHRSRVSHVKNVTMTHVASSQDIARSLWGAAGAGRGEKRASPMAVVGETIHARSLPHIRIT